MMFFIHIPKTAGTTLRSIVDAQYGPRNVILYYNQPSPQLLENLGAYLQTHAFAAMIGHFPIGVHDGATQQAVYATFLRDPETLVPSTYAEIMKNCGPHGVPEAAEAGLSLEQFIDRHGEHLRDIQTGYLAGGRLRYYGSEAPAQIAIANLQGPIAFFGLCERFEESVLMMSRQFGWRPCLFGDMNVRTDTPAIDQTVVRKIRDLTIHDRSLYDWARLEFEARVARQPPEFGQALAELRRLRAGAGEFDGSYREARICDERTMPAVARYLAM